MRFRGLKNTLKASIHIEGHPIFDDHLLVGGFNPFEQY